MQIKEAEYLEMLLERLATDELGPLLDIGSSTLKFRTQTQPYIEKKVFLPLAQRGVKVYHADIKQATGVDLVGDLLDQEFQQKLFGLGLRSVMAASVFQHVADVRGLAQAIEAIVPRGGYIVVSGPYRYPIHRDPIDNGWRPTPEQAASLFPSADLVEGAIVDGGNWRQWNAAERGGRTLGRFVGRLFCPFYQLGKWREVAAHAPFLVCHMKTYIALLRKR